MTLANPADAPGPSRSQSPLIATLKHAQYVISDNPVTGLAFGMAVVLILAALLIGVNAGPLITPWASLATILWAGRCRAAGVPVRWAEFVARGAIIAIPTVALGVAALTLGS